MMQAILKTKAVVRSLRFLVTFSVFMMLSVAQAADLGGAKAAGYVGEKLDGYLALIDNAAPADVKALVQNVNKKRRMQYERIAKKNKVNAADVGRLTAQKVIASAPSGVFVQQPGGKWVKK